MMGKTFEASVEDPVGVYVKKIRSSPGYDFDIPPRYARQFGERIREAVVYGQAMGFLKGGFLKEIAGEDPLKDLDLSKLVDLKQHSLPQLAQEFERFSIVGVQFPVGSQDEADILKRLIKKECGEPTGDVVVDVQTYPDKVVIRMPRVHGEIVFREYERLRTSGAVEPEYLHDEQDRVVHHPEKKTAWFEKESFPQPSQEDLRELGIREGVDYVPAGRGSVRPASEEAYWLLLEHSAQMDKRKEEEERAERKGERDELLELAHEIHRGLDMRLKRERPKKEKDSRGPVYYFLAGAAKYVAGLFREKTGLTKKEPEQRAPVVEAPADEIIDFEPVSDEPAPAVKAAEPPSNVVVDLLRALDEGSATVNEVFGGNAGFLKERRVLKKGKDGKPEYLLFYKGRGLRLWEERVAGLKVYPDGKVEIGVYHYKTRELTGWYDNEHIGGFGDPEKLIVDVGRLAKRVKVTATEPPATPPAAPAAKVTASPSAPRVPPAAPSASPPQRPLRAPPSHEDVIKLVREADELIEKNRQFFEEHSKYKAGDFEPVEESAPPASPPPAPAAPKSAAPAPTSPPPPPPPSDTNILEVEASIPREPRERRMRELKPEETDIEEIIAEKTRKAAGGKPGQ